MISTSTNAPVNAEGKDGQGFMDYKNGRMYQTVQPVIFLSVFELQLLLFIADGGAGGNGFGDEHIGADD